MISVITPALVKDNDGHQWLHECIASVAAQPGSWEHIIVNDHSPVSLDALKEHWPHVRWMDAEGQGVSMARNQAAEAARGELLLPLDADDKLGPESLRIFQQAWDKRGDAGIIYSDCVMFGEDYAKVYLAAEYSFQTLLKATFMTVGCLHQKADWDLVGGWRLDMQQGLEDWEYWIALGELGVCGKRVAEPLYWYRRHPRGRLQWLKDNQLLWDRAYQAMRELHRDSYDGRFPMGCCGGRARAAAPRAARATRPVTLAASASGVKSNGVLLVYTGARRGDFLITGGITRTKYHVPGPGNIVELAGNRVQGVNPADVRWFLSVNQGRDFKVVQQPQPAQPAPAPAPRPAPAPQPVSVQAWEPDIMVAEEAPEPELPDLQAMTVAEIRELEIDPEQAAGLLIQEWEGKDRKTVVELLEGLMG